MPDARISQGLYTADTTVFRCEKPLDSRPLRFVYAGQFIERKNVLRMCDAFLRFRRSWQESADLHLYGEGPLRDRIPRHPDIHVHAFASPQTLATALNDARCLVLPSKLDHWGVVVHEAVSCGMLLILSDTTGASEDLAGPVNSRLVRAGSVDDMVRAFQWAAEQPTIELAVASQESSQMASVFGLETWGATFDTICAGCGLRPQHS